MTNQAAERAVGYVRVSSEEQVEGLSLDAQRARIANYAQTRGYVLQHTYADEGVSGHTDQLARRPDLARLLTDAESGEFDVVLVDTLDRWSRRTSLQLTTLERLGRASVGFASVTEQIDYTSPSGRLVLTTLGATNQFISEQIGVHVRKAHEHRATRLGLPAGPIPYGYRVPEPGGTPEPDPITAPLVRQLFERRAAGESYREIAEWINGLGQTTPRGRPFAWETVRDLCSQRFFLGVIVYKGAEYPGKHTALITEDLFNRVQAHRNQRRRRRKPTSYVGSLQGRLHCVRCDQRLHLDHAGSGYTTYRERHRYECETSGRSIVANEIDRQIGEIFEAIELPETMVTAAAEAAVADRGPSRTDIESRRRRVVRAYLDDGLSENEYRLRLSTLDAQLRIAAPPRDEAIKEALVLAGDLAAVWLEATPAERRQLLMPLMDRVYVDLDMRRVAALVPTGPFAEVLAQASTRADAPVEVVPPGGRTVWWRRGRIELPVQRTLARDLLRV